MSKNFPLWIFMLVLMKTFTHINIKVLGVNVLLQSVILVYATIFTIFNCLNASAVGVQPTGGMLKVSTDIQVA